MDTWVLFSKSPEHEINIVIIIIIIIIIIIYFSLAYNK